MRLTIQPECGQWPRRLGAEPTGRLLDRPLASWREKTRLELGLRHDRPVIATGHQTLLWHPGILAKYLVVDAFADARGLGRANLIVDQHAGDFGSFEVPVRRPDGALGTRTVTLTTPRAEVPMGLHEPFTPPRPPVHLNLALPGARRGVQRIFDAAYAHRDAPNAALQMAAALTDLMQPWIGPMPNVTASDLVETSLARALLEAMVSDPRGCAEHYNRAVASVPEAHIGPLAIRDEYIELPLWRVRPDGRRMRAYDNDVERALDTLDPPRLLPRALFMTALIRLGMCDLFVHGTGGARYDRAMEFWIRSWLGVEVAPIVVATATAHLPLRDPHEPRLDRETEIAAARRLWHDPETVGDSMSRGTRKEAALAQIAAAPPGSSARRERFFRMHETLRALRERAAAPIAAAQSRAEQASRQAAESAIVNRRTWPFPLYPDATIDELAAACRAAARCGPACAAPDG
ncbi:MAG: hypothetical protein ACYTGG_02075 [Planctomycetota bacterium]